MSDRILGIIGPGLGPKVSTVRIKRPLFKVVGMKTGIVTLHLINENTVIRAFDSCGVYEVEPAEHMQVSYDGQCKSAVCTIHAGKVNAVHST